MDDLSQSDVALSEHSQASVKTTTQKPKVPVFKISYNGRHGAVFRLHILNLFMNVITLGIYSFWGKTRIRRYMISHISLAKDQFEYTGTGKELLVGALKASLIFIPLVIGLSIPFVKLVFFPLLFAVISLAIYLALRYRLSRTRWRGIRFGLAGSIKEYLILSVKRSVINFVTLGWKIPSSDIMKWSYIANHMHYGDAKFSYQGDVSKLQKVHVLTIVLLIVMCGAPVIMGGVAKAKELIRHAERQHQAQIMVVQPNDGSTDVASGVPNAGIPRMPSSDDDSFLMLMGLTYLGFAVGGGARLWYHAALWREKFRGLRLAGTGADVPDIRFKCDVTGKGLLKLYAVNILIIIFSLGLAKPIAANRVLKYYTSNIRIGGDVNALSAGQSTAAVKSGMGDALAADVGFDLGL